MIPLPINKTFLTLRLAQSPIVLVQALFVLLGLDADIVVEVVVPVLRRVRVIGGVIGEARKELVTTIHTENYSACTMRGSVLSTYKYSCAQCMYSV